MSHRSPSSRRLSPTTFRRTPGPSPLNTTVAGVIDSGDVDCVAVSLRKGQRLSAEVQAVRLGGEMTDTVLTVLGPDGRQLAQADDTPITRQDPFVTFAAPTDGTYTIQVRETAFGGGPNSTYAPPRRRLPPAIGRLPAGGPDRERPRG